VTVQLLIPGFFDIFDILPLLEQGEYVNQLELASITIRTKLSS
jgi:hypothetical protein